MNTTMGVRTRRLCMVLRRLREESGLTTIEVANRMGVNASTVSRAETGKRRLTSEDLASMLAIYGTSRPLRNALLRFHADADKPSLIDRGELHLHADLEKWIGFEQDATHIYNYEPLLIPGLLQTFPYARAVIASGVRPRTDEEIDDRVAARIARQAMLRQPNRPELEVLLHEAALRHPVGGAAIMRDQLGCLVESACRRGITIRIIPNKIDAHTGMDGPFVVMDYRGLPSLVLLENKVASLYLDEPGDVETYKLAFGSLLAVALSTDRSIEMMRKIAMGMV
ncbi:MAG TPA: helix-turn-helix transcriptional regulator [Actinophytocola sp.]|uniref:helix-turn-helix domain-containing protein n=1 Tax=Actinophytocola sp. TaxID=1872138 RepID=UPI002DB5C1EA|nr:helix-turn-helix transcriptional regulator [Actinophytocola sp.]HEU5474058.1 helix-turn-helix transcriptional regulator [Actinophytocola sp.]